MMFNKSYHPKEDGCLMLYKTEAYTIFTQINRLPILCLIIEGFEKPPIETSL